MNNLVFIAISVGYRLRGIALYFATANKLYGVAGFYLFQPGPQAERQPLAPGIPGCNGR